MPPRLPLAFCTNAFPGHDIQALLRKAGRLFPATSGPVSLGLWVSAQAARQLEQPQALAECKRLLAEHGLVVPCLNGFPFGNFHGRRVKARVYQPDWQDRRRLAHTRRLAVILAALLPPGADGSVSTVPGACKTRVKDARDVQQMAAHLAACAVFLARLESRTGHCIHLGLEPEPFCHLETAADAIRFFKENLWHQGWRLVARQMGLTRPRAEEILRRHIGICFDTCHFAVMFEDLAGAWRALRAEDIRISRVQLTAALEAPNTTVGRRALATFDEPVYLHQVCAAREGRRAFFWPDLAQALAELPALDQALRIRVHFHVPLAWTPRGLLQTTRRTLTPAFRRALLAAQPAPVVEVETYTLAALPAAARAASIPRFVRQEMQWAQAWLAGKLVS